MSAQKPSSHLKNKADVIPSVNRNNESTAADWTEVATILEDHAEKIDANTSALPIVNIQNAIVQKALGNTDLTQFEGNDKFGYWVNDNRYVVGKVVGLPVTLTNDIDDALKITLIYDSAALIHVNIQGATVETAGKTDLTQFQVGDKLTYWYENDTKYLVGKVKAIPISLPTDAEDKNKILPVYKGMI